MADGALRFPVVEGSAVRALLRGRRLALGTATAAPLPLLVEEAWMSTVDDHCTPSAPTGGKISGEYVHAVRTMRMPLVMTERGGCERAKGGA